MLLRNFLVRHIDETKWINTHKDEALVKFNSELKRLTTQTIPADALKQSLTRLELTWDPITSSLYKSAENAFDIGFLGKTKPNLVGIYDLTSPE